MILGVESSFHVRPKEDQTHVSDPLLYDLHAGASQLMRDFVLALTMAGVVTALNLRVRALAPHQFSNLNRDRKDHLFHPRLLNWVEHHPARRDPEALLF